MVKNFLLKKKGKRFFPIFPDRRPGGKRRESTSRWAWRLVPQRSEGKKKKKKRRAQARPAARVSKRKYKKSASRAGGHGRGRKEREGASSPPIRSGLKGRGKEGEEGVSPRSFRTIEPICGKKGGGEEERQHCLSPSACIRQGVQEDVSTAAVSARFSEREKGKGDLVRLR